MTAQLVTDAIVMAVWRRGKPEAVMHHSDRGSQNTSDEFQRLLEEMGVTCSMGRAGNVWDNSAMESFFSSLKIERTNRKTYRSRDEARSEVFDYIERFYNTRRRHSTIGYVRPAEFEKRVGLAWDCVHGTGSGPDLVTSAPNFQISFAARTPRLLELLDKLDAYVTYSLNGSQVRLLLSQLPLH